MSKNKGNIKKEQYPKSTNGLQCVGPCYYSKTRIIHPLTLEELAGIPHNFCPVNTFVYTSKTGQNVFSNFDRCFVPTANDKDIQNDELFRESVMAPQFIFSSEFFVKIYYKINTIDDLLKWLNDSKDDPYKTKERVFNNSMVAYGKDLNIADLRLVNFINDVMMANLPKIFRHLKKYLTIENDTIKLINPKEKYVEDTEASETMQAYRNYIKEKFLGTDNVHQFMSKFLRYYKEELSNRYISDVLVNHFIDYTEKRIQLTLEQNKE